MNSPTVRRDLNPSSGFSLVEMVVAVLILSIGVLGMSTVMGTIAASETRATLRIETTEIVQNKLEEIRAIASSRTADTVILAVGGSLTTPQANHVDTTRSAGGRRFIRLWTAAAGPGGSRIVTVRGETFDTSPSGVRPVDLTTNVLIDEGP
jgi:prepilin-type N-terminal cleavage/methylation domain-containing protein